MSNTVREREARLPAAEPQNPRCGVCSADTSFDGDSFRCDRCGLLFSPNDLSASLADDVAPQCVAACDNEFHLQDLVFRGYRYACVSCALTAGHTDDHSFGCRLERIPPEHS